MSIEAQQEVEEIKLVFGLYEHRSFGLVRRDEQARQDTRGTFGTFANLASPISSLIQQDEDSLDRRKEGEAGE
jgi:hypothetical protein